MEKRASCYSPAILALDKPDTARQMELSDRLLVPERWLRELHSITDVYLFEVTNSEVGRVMHAGVLEFSGVTDGVVYMPAWMMHNLALEESAKATFVLRSLPRITYLRLQPRDHAFADAVVDAKAVLEETLRHFSAVTESTALVVHHADVAYEFQVLKVRPESASKAACLIEAEFNLEMAPPESDEDELLEGLSASAAPDALMGGVPDIDLGLSSIAAASSSGGAGLMFPSIAASAFSGAPSFAQSSGTPSPKFPPGRNSVGRPGAHRILSPGAPVEGVLPTPDAVAYFTATLHAPGLAILFTLESVPLGPADASAATAAPASNSSGGAMASDVHSSATAAGGGRKLSGSGVPSGGSGGRAPSPAFLSSGSPLVTGLRGGSPIPRSLGSGAAEASMLQFSAGGAIAASRARAPSAGSTPAAQPGGAAGALDSGSAAALRRPSTPSGIMLLDSGGGGGTVSLTVGEGGTSSLPSSPMTSSAPSSSSAAAAAAASVVSALGLGAGHAEADLWVSRTVSKPSRCAYAWSEASCASRKVLAIMPSDAAYPPASSETGSQVLYVAVSAFGGPLRFTLRVESAPEAEAAPFAVWSAPNPLQQQVLVQNSGSSGGSDGVRVSLGGLSLRNNNSNSLTAPSGASTGSALSSSSSSGSASSRPPRPLVSNLLSGINSNRGSSNGSSSGGSSGGDSTVAAVPETDMTGGASSAMSIDAAQPNGVNQSTGSAADAVAGGAATATASVSAPAVMIMSPSSSTPAATSTSAAPLDSRTCGNCGQAIPIRTFDLHSSYCARNNWKCPTCSAVVRAGAKGSHVHCGACNALCGGADALAKHEALVHTPAMCDLCRAPVLPEVWTVHADHACPSRRVPCVYCKMLLPFKDCDGHEMMCGGRTIQCDACGRLIPRKRLERHQAVDHGIGDVSRFSGMTPITPFMRATTAALIDALPDFNLGGATTNFNLGGAGPSVSPAPTGAAAGGGGTGDEGVALDYRRPTSSSERGLVTETTHASSSFSSAFVDRTSGLPAGMFRDAYAAAASAAAATAAGRGGGANDSGYVSTAAAAFEAAAYGVGAPAEPRRSLLRPPPRDSDDAVSCPSCHRTLPSLDEMYVHVVSDCPNEGTPAHTALVAFLFGGDGAAMAGSSSSSSSSSGDGGGGRGARVRAYRDDTAAAEFEYGDDIDEEDEEYDGNDGEGTAAGLVPSAGGASGYFHHLDDLQQQQQQQNTAAPSSDKDSERGGTATAETSAAAAAAATAERNSTGVGPAFDRTDVQLGGGADFVFLPTAHRAHSGSSAAAPTSSSRHLQWQCPCCFRYLDGEEEAQMHVLTDCPTPWPDAIAAVAALRRVVPGGPGRGWTEAAPRSAPTASSPSPVIPEGEAEGEGEATSGRFEPMYEEEEEEEEGEDMDEDSDGGGGEGEGRERRSSKNSAAASSRIVDSTAAPADTMNEANASISASDLTFTETAAPFSSARSTAAAAAPSSARHSHGGGASSSRGSAPGSSRTAAHGSATAAAAADDDFGSAAESASIGIAFSSFESAALGVPAPRRDTHRWATPAEAAFACPSCGQGFEQPDVMQVHMLTDCTHAATNMASMFS